MKSFFKEFFILFLCFSAAVVIWAFVSVNLADSLHAAFAVLIDHPFVFFFLLGFSIVFVCLIIQGFKKSF